MGKQSTYKEAILKLLRQGGLFTMAEIHSNLPQANFSTIYRNVEKLVQDNELKQVTINKNLTQYEISKEAHGHFVCKKCATVECVSLPSKYFPDKSVSDVMVRGLCLECKDCYDKV